MSRIKRLLDEDFEREGTQDIMFKGERDREMEEEYYQWLTDHGEVKLPANIVTLTKKFRKSKKHHED